MSKETQIHQKETCLVYILLNYDNYVDETYTHQQKTSNTSKETFTHEKSPGKEPYLLSCAPKLKNCDMLQNTATHCRTLQHTAEHCNTLQHTATISASTGYNFWKPQHQMSQNTGKHWTATHCNKLQLRVAAELKQWSKRFRKHSIKCVRRDLSTSKETYENISICV